MGVISAPPRKDIYCLWGQYGMIGGADVHPRARMWLLTESADPHPDLPIFLRIAWNTTTGAVEYADLGQIAQATVRDRSAEVHLPDGRVYTLAIAPCVCGAGAVGNALPEEGRISLANVNPYGRTKLTFV
jgi:hypothetical protein